MEIRNLMEDIVVKLVDEICAETAAKSGGEEFCTSPRCRQDIACFVLNRIPPHYVSSARGTAYTDKSMAEDAQVVVDIVTLVHEGLRRVSVNQRPYYSGSGVTGTVEGPVFGFPTIKGRLMSATTFEPLSEGNVFLLSEGEPLDMIDSRWENPFLLNAQIPGSYLFLPKPVRADGVCANKTFELEVAFRHPKFEEFHHYFRIDLTMEEDADLASKRIGDWRLPDLFVPPL
jgi:competence protein ComFB